MKEKNLNKSAVTFSDLSLDFYRPITITVIGCGATGSLFVNGIARLNEALSLLNIGTLFVKVIDNDVFESHNIGRQTCSPADIGLPKAKVTVERINRYYGNSWCYDIAKFDDNYAVTKTDIIVSCVDNIRTRLNIFKLNRNTIDIGNDRDYGQVIFSRPKLMPNTEQLFGLSKMQETNTTSCSAYESLSKQSLYINTFAAMYACQMLHDLFVNRYINYNQVYFSINPINVKSKFQLL
jgi:PRTRC genetic system ThiF family protein